MGERWELKQEAFDELLFWLDSDREAAARKYETIRAGLVKIMFYSSSLNAEELADEVINRVTQKLPEMRKTYEGDPARYFYGVAKNVAREYPRRPKGEPFVERVHTPPNPKPTDELRYQCLERCLQKQSAKNAELLRCYYQEDRPDQRKNLARLLGITEESLRVRIHRLMQPVKKCVKKCMQYGNPMK